MINEITANEFGASISNCKDIVLVNFTANWCAPCQIQHAILEVWSNTQDRNIFIYKVDVDRSPELAIKYQVRNIPTMVVFKEGKEVFNHMGLIKDTELDNIINEASSPQ